jgi:uncharacterized phage protein (TIGR02216 family)
VSVLPWSALLAAAMRMAIAPEVFWRVSLKEWRLITSDSDALGRVELAALAKQYPDGGVDGE